MSVRFNLVVIGGEDWHSDGNIWLVRFKSPGGRLVVISEDTVCQYDDEAALSEGRAAKTIEPPATTVLSR